MRTVIDLTHVITPGMPVYPGTEPPTLQEATTVERDGFAEKRVCFYSHTGTHVDAPAHMLAGGLRLDAYDAGYFVGEACVVDVAGHHLVPTAALAAHDALLDGCAFVLLHTGWARYWGHERYFHGFPVLSVDAARWLVARGVRGVGVDAISVDPVDSTTFENHHELFRAGRITIENLRGLDALVGRRFGFSCLPMRIEQADGAPVRAVAIVD